MQVHNTPFIFMQIICTKMYIYVCIFSGPGSSCRRRKEENARRKGRNKQKNLTLFFPNIFASYEKSVRGKLLYNSNSRKPASAMAYLANSTSGAVARFVVSRVLKPYTLGKQPCVKFASGCKYSFQRDKRMHRLNSWLHWPSSLIDKNVSPLFSAIGQNLRCFRTCSVIRGHGRHGPNESDNNNRSSTDRKGTTGEPGGKLCIVYTCKVCNTRSSKVFSKRQGCHVSGKSQGKTKFSPGQGILKKCQGILAI